MLYVQQFFTAKNCYTYSSSTHRCMRKTAVVQQFFAVRNVIIQRFQYICLRRGLGLCQIDGRKDLSASRLNWQPRRSIRLRGPGVHTVLKPLYDDISHREELLYYSSFSHTAMRGTAICITVLCGEELLYIQQFFARKNFFSFLGATRNTKRYPYLPAPCHALCSS